MMSLAYMRAPDVHVNRVPYQSVFGGGTIGEASSSVVLVGCVCTGTLCVGVLLSEGDGSVSIER